MTLNLDKKSIVDHSWMVDGEAILLRKCPILTVERVDTELVVGEEGVEGFVEVDKVVEGLQLFEFLEGIYDFIVHPLPTVALVVR